MKSSYIPIFILKDKAGLCTMRPWSKQNFDSYSEVILRKKKKNKNKNKKTMLGQKYSGKIGISSQPMGKWYDHKQEYRMDCALLILFRHWQFWATGKLSSTKSKKSHRNKGRGSTEQRLGRPHVYDSFALNSGNSCKPKDSLSWKKWFNSISWHK